MATYRNVLLIGGSGTLGSVVLKILLDSPYNTTVLSRQQSSSQFPEGVRVIRADYDDPNSLKSAIKGQDVVISTVGGAATGDQNRFIDAAVAAGVKRFLPSEYGPNTQDPRVVEFIPILPSKMQTVDYLRSKEDRMEWTSLVTGLWFDWALRDGHLGFDLVTKTATLTDDGNTEFTVSTLESVGKAILKILEHPEETKNIYVYTSSFNLSQDNLLTVLEKIDGQDWTVKQRASKDFVEEGHRRVQKGDYSGIPLLVRALATGPVNLGDSRPGGLWDERLGLEREDLEQVVRRVVAEKRNGTATA
ncbi:unnamed protein product [Alternaria alternata]